MYIVGRYCNRCFLYGDSEFALNLVKVCQNFGFNSYLPLPSLHCYIVLVPVYKSQQCSCISDPV